MSSDQESSVGDVYLALPHPTSRDIKDHPIHSRGEIGYKGYRFVDNYTDPFIQAIYTAAHLWPRNANDWGFEEYLPSQFHTVPEDAGHSHPMLNKRGRPVLCDDIVYPAFTYRVPFTETQCRQCRSCRVTHWVIDPETEEAVIAKCWACRRMGRFCSLEGKRFPRLARNGIMIHHVPFSELYGYKRPKNPARYRTRKIEPGMHRGYNLGWGAGKGRRDNVNDDDGSDDDDDDDDDDNKYGRAPRRSGSSESTEASHGRNGGGGGRGGSSDSKISPLRSLSDTLRSVSSDHDGRARNHAPGRNGPPRRRDPNRVSTEPKTPCPRPKKAVDESLFITDETDVELETDFHELDIETVKDGPVVVIVIDEDEGEQEAEVEPRERSVSRVAELEPTDTTTGAGNEQPVNEVAAGNQDELVPPTAETAETAENEETSDAPAVPSDGNEVEPDDPLRIRGGTIILEPEVKPEEIDIDMTVEEDEDEESDDDMEGIEHLYTIRPRDLGCSEEHIEVD